GDVGRVGAERYGCRERGVMRAELGIGVQGCGRQMCPGVRPEVADVGTNIAWALVEANRGDVAANVGTEPDSQLDRIRVKLRSYRSEERRVGKDSRSSRHRKQCR